MRLLTNYWKYCRYTYIFISNNPQWFLIFKGFLKPTNYAIHPTSPLL